MQKGGFLPRLSVLSLKVLIVKNGVARYLSSGLQKINNGVFQLIF